jgi:hypothetical protein
MTDATILDIRVIRATAISEFAWLFRIHRADGRFQAILCDGTQEAEPLEDWQPELDGEDAYQFYCEMYLDHMIGEDAEKAYAFANELLHATELLDDGDDT